MNTLMLGPTSMKAMNLTFLTLQEERITIGGSAALNQDGIDTMLIAKAVTTSLISMLSFFMLVKLYRHRYHNPGYGPPEAYGNAGVCTRVQNMYINGKKGNGKFYLACHFQTHTAIMSLAVLASIYSWKRIANQLEAIKSHNV